MPIQMRLKAEASVVDMDATLTEAFFAFYWLNSRRSINYSFNGDVIPSYIPLCEIKDYYNIFNVSIPIDHFVRVVVAADREYVKIQFEKTRNASTKGGK